MIEKNLSKNICIWKDASECGECRLSENLFCRPQSKYAIFFGIPSVIAIIAAIIGVVLSNFIWIEKLAILGIWIIYSIFFFAVWESRIICNHCPYYANSDQKTLQCPIDKGKPKTGKYNPSPINTSEKIQFIIGGFATFFFLIPFIVTGGQVLFAIISLISFLVWIVVIQTKVCTECVNFSCAMNRVDVNIRNEFLKRNPVILKSWKEAGYTIN